MNYEKIYNDLIAKGQNRILEEGVYVERHHIIPRCLGGSDDASNLVKLTPEEHFVAHQLLAKIHPKIPGLLYACIAMSGDPSGKGRRSNKLYGWLRRRHSEILRTRVTSEETRRKLSETHKRLGTKPPDPTGKKHTQESLEKMSRVQKGRIKSSAHREALSKAHIGLTASEETKALLSSQRKGVPKSESHRKAIGEANRGRPHTPERIKNMVEGRKRKAEERRLAQLKIEEEIKLK
jgi:hypothetical protein